MTLDKRKSEVSSVISIVMSFIVTLRDESWENVVFVAPFVNR